MAKPRTKEDDDAIESEYARLSKGIKFEFGNQTHISLVERMGRVGNDERLMIKNKGKKLESVYRSKMILGKKNLLASLDYYLKNTK